MSDNNDLRGYKKVFVYKLIDNPKVIYVSKSLHFLNKFFANRYSGDISKFIYDGEMMARIGVSKFYVQVYHGVYKRIYKNENKKVLPVKLKKDWCINNFKLVNNSKIKQVIVGWKHCVKIKLEGKTNIIYKFPKITYEGNDLIGRTIWSDKKWLRQAILDYTAANYDPKNIDETFVNRIKK